VSTTRCIVGIDMGGTRIKAVLHNAATDEEIDRAIQPTGDRGEEQEGTPPWALALKQLIEDWETKHDVIIEAVGIACPGLASRDGRCIEYLPGRLHGLVGFNFSEFLGRHSRVINDAQAAMLGEIAEGAAQGRKNLVMLTLGTGVGGAILADGRLLRGHLGRAGHCGHLCLDPEGEPGITGTPGSLEDAIGNHNVKARSNGRFESTLDLTNAVRAGDAEAKAVWDKSVKALACGIASLINVVDPEAILLAGGIAEVGDLLFDPLRAELDRIEWRPGNDGVEILHATLGEWAGAIGALAYISN